MIEMMFVVVIIGILASIAIPSYSNYRHRAILVEGFSLAEPVKKDILDYYSHVGKMPEDNTACGQPAADLIRGKYVSSLTVSDGSIDIHFNDTFSGPCSNATMTLTPKQYTDNPSGIFTWQQDGCGQRR